MCVIPCTCGAVVDLRKFHDQDKILKFLKGLNDQFSNVNSQIMMMDPLPNLDITFSLILGQEKQLTTSTNSEPLLETPTLASQVQPQTGNGRGFQFSLCKGRGQNNNYGGCENSSRNTCICIHYGRNNHIFEYCFVKHGYPPDFQHRSKVSFINSTFA